MNLWESTVRRAHYLFSPMSITPTDDLPPTLLFSNGDFYTGQYSSSSNIPFNRGKYLWSDGCMYEGQWSSDGLPNGKGKFSWPTGAIYEGNFNAGFMDGFGTYTDSSGATYRGFWRMNQRHGDGTKSYANGDFYQGEWSDGLPHGYGCYSWENGNEYLGQWKGGVVHGNGTFSTGKGERFECEWEAGRPAGRGIDCRAFKECKISQAEVMTVFPSEKMFNWSGCVVRVDGDEESCCSGGRKRMQMRFRSCVVGGKRQGESISKGHKNYELMLNLQLGIR